MTINIADNSPRVNYTATSGQTVFTVSFEFFEDADLSVYINGTEKTITTHYTVSGGDGSTGTVTLTSGATAGDKVAIVRDVSLQRTSDFTEGAAISRAALNEQLDIITAQIADVDDKASRALQLNDHEVAVSITLPATDDRKGKILGFNASTGAVEAGPTLADTQSLADVSADIATLADIEDGTDATDAIQTVAGISSNVSTVAGISGNVTTVAGISSNVTAVAGDATDIGTVAGSISNVNTVAGIDSNITTVAGNTTNINTVAGNNSNITTVAGISDNITTVAGISSNVTTVAGISVSVPTVAGVASNVTTVANNISDVNTVATNISSITTKVNKSGDTMTGNLEFDDDVKAIFGTRNSLQIFHDATAITASNIKLYFTNGSTSGTMEITDSDHTVSVSDVVRVDSPEILNSTPVSATGVVQSSLQQDLTVSAVTSTTFTVPVTYASDPGSTGFLEQAGTYYYYTGTSKSYISEQSVGPLNILTSELNVYNAAETSQLAQFSTSASKLFHNNSEKLATTSSGISVTGGLTVSGDLTVQGTTVTIDSASAQTVDLGDNDKIRLGDGDDLQIYHDGSNSNIKDVGTGPLKIFATDLYINNSAGNKTHLSGIDGGAVTLYYNGSSKLATTSTGIDVTGTVTADGLTVDTNTLHVDSTNNRVGIGTSSPAVPLHVKVNTDQNFYMSSDSGVRIQAMNDAGSVINTMKIGGDPLIFLGTGGTERMRIDSSGNVGIGTTSPSQKLDISSGYLNFSNAYGIRWGGNTSEAIYGNNTGNLIGFQTNGSERMRIDSSGNVGIGTSSPDDKLHVYSTSSLDHIKVDGPAAINRNVQFSTAGSARWNIYANSTAETGSNAGSNLSIARYADNGSYISGAVLIERSTGNIGIGTTSPAAKLHINETETATYSSSAVQGDLIISRKNTSNTNNQTVGLEFDVTGWSGSTTGVAVISAVQPSNTSSADLVFQNRSGGGYAENMRITSAGNVGIGTDSPTDYIHIHNTADSTALIHFTNGATGSASTDGFKAGVTVGGDAYLRQREAANLLFYTSDAERMRIDSSGGVHVGGTSESGTGQVSLNPSGYIKARKNNVSGIFDRITTDGDIVQFRKDGSTVGIIGVQGGDAYYAGTSKGIKAVSGFIGATNTTGVLQDNNTDLGSSSYRFKDLYLSGGVYLGGTGSANLLDDYEEGTFTPTLGAPTAGTISYAYQYGSYTKIGRVVHFDVQFQVNSWTGHSGGLYIDSLPFTVANYSFHRGSATIAFNTLFTFAESGTHVHVSQNNTKVFFYDVGSTYQSGSQVSTQDGSGYLQVSGWYNVA